MKKIAFLAPVALLSGASFASAQSIDLTPTLKFTAQDGDNGDRFGSSVALSGDRALVGASRWGGEENTEPDQGAAYLFDTTTGAQTKLTAEGGEGDDRFGYSVALSGDRALVGAYGWAGEGNTEPFQGAAYLFDTEGTQTKLTAEDGEVGGYFGWSVALSGDRALVGAERWDGEGNTENARGAAYLFDTEGTQTGRLTAEDGDPFDYFGRSVALSGDRALVGASRWGGEENTEPDQGAAYLFDTTTGAQTKLTAEDGEEGDLFGRSVALSGDRALVGAFGWAGEGNTEPDRGAAYLFDTEGTQTGQLTAEDGESSDYFGYSVALSGNLAVVGAVFADDDDSGYAFYESGAAYLFDVRNGQQLAKLTAGEDANFRDRFGWSVAIDGSRALIGTERGEAAYLFDLAPDISARWNGVFGGQFDSDENWSGLTPEAALFAVEINPDSTQTITGPAGASEIVDLTLGAGAGVATLDLQAGGGLISDNTVTIAENGVLQGTGGIIAPQIANAGTIKLTGLGLTGAVTNSGLVEGSGTFASAFDNAEDGEVFVGPGEAVVFKSAATNSGTIQGRDASMRFDEGLTNTGAVQFSAGTTDIFGEITNGLAGTITNSGNGTLTLYDAVFSEGNINTFGTGTTIFMDAYSGPGDFAGDGAVILRGSVSTGASPGLAEFGGDTTLESTATTLMELEGTARGTEYDAWDVTGSLTLGGTLDLVALNSFLPALGQSFNLFSADGGILGDFDMVNLLALSEGLEWTEQRTANSYGFAVTSVQPVPLPAGVWMLLAGMGALLWRRRSHA